MIKEEYGFVDVSKLILSVCVVAIHTQPLFGMTSCYPTKLFEFFISCAVPFFFLTSGYFIELKNVGGGYLFERLKQSIRTYLVASAVYMPLAIYNYVEQNYSPLFAVIHYLRSLFLVGSNYNSAILWYLLSSIYGLVFVIVLKNRGHTLSNIVRFGFVVFCFGILCSMVVENQDNLPALIKDISVLIKITIRNGRIFSGFFYLPLGMFLATKKLSLSDGITFFAFSVPIGALVKQPFYSLLVATASVGLFIIVTQVRLKPSPKYRWLRMVSAVVYFTHMYIWTIYCFFKHQTMAYGMEPFIVVSTLSLLLGCIYVYWKIWYKDKGKNL